MFVRLLFLTLLVFICGSPVNALAQAGTETTAKSPEQKALEEKLAILDLKDKILTKERALLKTEVGSEVTLPTGKVERDSAVILPSAIHYVSYDSLRVMAEKICADLPETAASEKATLFTTAAELRNIREQYLATIVYLRGIGDRVEDEIREVEQLGKSTQQGPRTVAGVASTLLALDAVGAVGKAIAGISGFFKSDRKIGAADAIVTAEHVILALRACNPNKITLIDPTLVQLSEADIFGSNSTGKRLNSKVEDALQLKDSAQKLRRLISEKEQSLEELKRDLALIAESIAKEKDQAKKQDLESKSNKVKVKIDALSGALVAPKATLDVADTAIQGLYAVDGTSKVSSLVVLARMGKVIDALDSDKFKDSKILTVKVQHSSGYSQISSSWWRNDRIEFASGTAISYELSSQTGTIEKSNFFYVQTPWRRLNSEGESFSGNLTSLREIKSK